MWERLATSFRSIWGEGTIETPGQQEAAAPGGRGTRREMHRTLVIQGHSGRRGVRPTGGSAGDRVQLDSLHVHRVARYAEDVILSNL